MRACDVVCSSTFVRVYSHAHCLLCLALATSVEYLRAELSPLNRHTGLFSSVRRLYWHAPFLSGALIYSPCW